MNEEKLTKELETYKELAKADKKIDVASLMINALQQHKQNNLTDKEKRWAYLVSLVAPPLGLIFAVKFYFSGKDDAEQAALMCGILTTVSIMLVILFGKFLFSGTGVSLDKVQKIRPSDLEGL